MPADSCRQLLPKPVFEIIRVSCSYANKAARRALRALLPRVRYPSVETRTFALTRLWLDRIDAMYQRGWRPLSEKDKWRIRRCPPVGVSAKGAQPHSCNYNQVCPWCFARKHAVPLYKDLHRLFFETKKSQTPANYHLVEVHTHVVFPRDTVSLDYAVAWMATYKTDYLRKVFGRKPLALAWCQTLEPAYQEKKRSRVQHDVWYVHHRLLAVISPYAPDPPASVPSIDCYCPVSIRREIIRHWPISRSTLVKAVGNIASYPKYLLLPGHEEDTVSSYDLETTLLALEVTGVLAGRPVRRPGS